MPNAVAYLVLMAWPAVCLVLFQRLRIELALIWSILGAYLIVPSLTEFDLPLVPAMDKYTLPSLAALLIVVFVLRRKVSFWPDGWAMRFLLMGFVLGAIPTVLTNGDPILFELMPGSEPIVFITGALPGLRLLDIFSAVSTQILMLIPFFLARQFLSTEKGVRDVVLAFCLAALVYSLPALIEVRISPQFNILIYGFFQHSWEQMIRQGGFRPIVFLPHALWLAIFFVTALCATAALLRYAPNAHRHRFFAALVYLIFVLWLCKSLASMLYALALVPVVLFAPLRWQMRFALAMAVVALAYPMLRNLHLVPIDLILEKARAINVDRAQSLEFRFGNEEMLLERAAEKPLFGWGSWGRNLIRDPETGDILSIPDGRWIIMFGSHGWFGYICQMGMLAAPLLLLARALRRNWDRPEAGLVVALALILAVTMVDMLLNDTLVPVTWMVSGALLGYAERLRRAAPDPTPRQRSPGRGQAALPRRRTVM